MILNCPLTPLPATKNQNPRYKYYPTGGLSLLAFRAIHAVASIHVYDPQLPINPAPRCPHHCLLASRVR